MVNSGYIIRLTGFGEGIWYQELQLIRELDELRSQETNGNYLPGDIAGMEFSYSNW